MFFAAALAALAAWTPKPVSADFLARIGDIDGFGYGAATGFRSASGGAANLHGDPVLTARDFLPDINRDGFVATGKGDDFDLRGTAERNNTNNTFAPGVSNTAGTLGSKFTDISLSTSYDVSSAAGHVLVGDPVSGFHAGSGGPFPDPPANIPTSPVFSFHFDINKANLTRQNEIYFNIVFGDYDVVPAEVDLTLADGTLKVIKLSVQSKSADGLIQNATATLNFGDVFRDGGSLWTGSLTALFNEPNEPYTAFDYVELSTIPLAPIPEPSGVISGAIGLVTLGAYVYARRRRTTEPRTRMNTFSRAFVLPDEKGAVG